jgi:copper chaperone
MIEYRGNLKGKSTHMPTIKIKGMSCNHCVMAVTKALGGIEGVSNVKVDLAEGEATFDEATPVDRKVIGERIRKAGFEVA